MALRHATFHGIIMVAQGTRQATAISIKLTAAEVAPVDGRRNKTQEQKEQRRGAPGMHCLRRPVSERGAKGWWMGRGGNIEMAGFEETIRAAVTTIPGNRMHENVAKDADTK
jgi:hypothetical protein